VSTRIIPIWGNGNPRRKFLHTNDLADACLLLLSHYNQPDLVKVG